MYERADPVLPDLTAIPFLRDASPEALAAAGAEVQWFSLPGGAALFMEGEPAEAIYFLVSGSLGVFRSTLDGRTEFVAHIRAGDPVGEMSLIAGEPHHASVYALRDTELLRVDRASFNRLVRAHPSLMQNLARVMMFRLRQTKRRSNRADPRVFSLISTSPTIDLAMRARILKSRLETIGKRVCILDHEVESQSSTFFDEIERNHDIVMLISPVKDDNWFRLCLRQADRIWVLARSDARPSVPLLPADTSPARQFRLVDLILLNHAGAQQQVPTQVWKNACDAARVFHWNGIDDADGARLARTMAGQSVGLVLSGGGARAYAHVGVIKALRDARLPIDFVGGTSMGAIIAACVALGWSDDEIDWRIRKAFVDSNPLGDYVLPVVALTRGRRVDQRLAEHFGDGNIEDMPLPFFCVSTNLSQGNIRIHREGKLGTALRSTISLPGILPPMVDKGTDVLVDGAVLNNFPVDVMQEFHRGLTIGVDVARQTGITATDFINPPNFMQWVAGRGLQNAPPIASLLMRTATLGMTPWLGREKTDLLIIPELGHIDMRDWKLYDEATSAGYEASVEALKELQGALRRLVVV